MKTKVGITVAQALAQVEERGFEIIDRPDGAIGSSWEFINLDPILNGSTVEEPPSMLARTDGQGLLYRGRVHILAGEPEAGKSWLALAACAEQLTLGHHAVFLDFEDSASTAVERLRALGTPEEAIRARFHYAAPEDRPRGDVASLAPEGCPLVVLDGVTEALTLMGLKLLDNDDVARFLGRIVRPLAARGAGVLLLDHVTKDRDSRGRGPIGSQHKVAGVDVAYTLDTVTPFGRGLSGLSRLTVTKDRPGFIRAASASRKLSGDVRLHSEGDDRVGLSIEPVTFSQEDSPGLRPAVRRVLEALPAGPHGVYPREVGDRVAQHGESGLRRETIQRALRELAERGLADGAEGRWWRCDLDASE